MAISTVLKKILILFCLVNMSLFVVHCSSSDDDSSALEGELENIDDVGDGETMADDIEELSEVAEEDLEDVVDDGEETENLDVAENEDDESYDDEESFDDEDEFDEEDVGEEIAENDSDDESEDDSEFSDDEDDEFAEFDDIQEGDSESGDGEIDQSEKGLAEEINGQGDYPVAQNSEPQFPDEVMNAQSDAAASGQGAMGSSPVPPGAPLITSETQEITVAEEPVGPLLPQDDLGDPDPIIEPDEDDGPIISRTWIPVVKVKTDPFFRNQRLMNAVYIARPNDDMFGISEKIYKEDRTKELSADNPHLAKGIDPGDKVYYNSPNRPDDRSNLKIYYADNGLPPQYYRTVANDNMRRLGSKLLGFPDGWKEVWAINQSVDSKTILPAGIELRYWTGNEQKPGMEVAETDTTTEPLDNPLSDPEPLDDTGPEAMPENAGSVEDPFEDDLPPEPPMPDTQVAIQDPEPVPDIEPFPEEGVEQTPGPAPVAQVSNQSKNDSLLSVAAIALLGMAMIGLVAIQIKKRKDNTGMSPQSLEYTQV